MTAETCTSDDAFSITGNTISYVLSGFSCVSIPEKIVSIEDGSKTNYAFQLGINFVNKVDFSKASNLESIGDFAFYDCKKITEIDLSKCPKLSVIGKSCFYNCQGTKSIKLPEVSLIKTFKQGCFCFTGITSFIIPNSVTTILGISPDNDGNDGVFAFCYYLNDIVFQSVSSCTAIGTKAFFNTPITSITFPASIKSLSTDTSISTILSFL